jgi:hypothetical protein
VVVVVVVVLGQKGKGIREEEMRERREAITGIR